MGADEREIEKAVQTGDDREDERRSAERHGRGL
jgi:hypothetical protein